MFSNNLHIVLYFIVSLSFLLMLSNCTSEDHTTQFILSEITIASRLGGESNLFTDQNGTAYLSWIEYLNDSTDVLYFSTLEGRKWTPPKEIARGTDWFVNWADFPSIAVSNNGNTIAAHWLQKRAAGTYDYDIHISFSQDGGDQWSNPFIPHRDSIAAEHGFVTLLPFAEDAFFATWLDGRNTKVQTTMDAHDHGHGAEPMSLRAAVFNSSGKFAEEIVLDEKVCDCCQTDAAITKNGPVAVYRDRSNEEIRDISMVRKVDQDWTHPRQVNSDGWKINGCPVNGPAIDQNGQKLAVAWFTQANNEAKVNVVFSNDLGATFNSPIRVDDGNPLGRVDLVLKNDLVYLSWLEGEKDKESAQIRLAVLDFSTENILQKTTLINTSPARKSGFPILIDSSEGLLLSWTAVEKQKTKIRTALIEAKKEDTH